MATSVHLVAQITHEDGLVYRLNESKPFEILVIDDALGTDLTAATALITVYNSVGTATLAATPMTGSGSTRKRFSYLLTTGAAKNLTASGDYRVKIAVTLGSAAQDFQWPVQVLADPS